jgi:hypothetical protein
LTAVPRTHFLTFLLLAALLHGAELTIQVTDEAGQLLLSRIEVRGPDGKMYQPQGAIEDKTARVSTGGPEWYRGHYVAQGTSTLDVPPGKYTVIAEKGPEFERKETTVEVGPDKPVRVRYQLRPWIRMNDLGWWSGDMHVHRPLEDVPTLMKTEELNLAVSYTMWVTAQSSRDHWRDKPAPSNPVEIVSPRHLHMLMNAEDERRSGAWMLIGLPAPFDFGATSPWYPHGLRFVERARALRAKTGVLPWFEVEKAIWWEVPIMVALGAPDSVGLLFNHFNQYGINASEAWGRPRDLQQFPGPEGFAHYVLGLVYRYLNLGFRFAQTAGSASGVLQAPVGYNRVYARLDGQFSVENWFRALRGGESFVTNGPMLFTTFRTRDRAVDVEIDVRSREPIDRVEIVGNGVVIQTIRPTGESTNLRRLVSIDGTKNSWIAVRCWQKGVPTIRLAHSMPFHLKASWDASEDARYYINWIDALIADTNADTARFASRAERDEVLAIYQKARTVYRRKTPN